MTDDLEVVARQWMASRAMAEIAANGFAQADIDEFFEPADPVEAGLQVLQAAVGVAKHAHPDVIAMLVVPLGATEELTVSAPELAAVVSSPWEYGPGREVVGLYLLQPWVLATDEPGEEYRCHVDAGDVLGGGWSARFRSWRSRADAAKGWEFNQAFYIRAQADDEDGGPAEDRGEAALDLRAAGAKFDAVLPLSEAEVDDAIEHFEQLRRHRHPVESADESIHDAWTDEIGSRVDDILSGKVRTVPHDEVRAKLAADRAARDAAREK